MPSYVIWTVKELETASKSSSENNHIIIVGAGVFGLSTALALIKRHKYAQTTVTIFDAARELPNAEGASVDTSRILRADYAVQSYTKLMSDAKRYWKDTSDRGWGGQGRYHQASLLLTSQPGTEGHVDGYLEESVDNFKSLAQAGEHPFDVETLKVLENRAAIEEETPLIGASGEHGYVNQGCGWVNAEACVEYALERLRNEGAGRVRIERNTKVHCLLYDESHLQRCCGVVLDDERKVEADLVIVAAGAWTPSLVDLGGRATATGQALAYLSLSQEEQHALESLPIYFNMSRGMFMVPPHDGVLKVGRHGFGYQNPVRVSYPVRRRGSGAATGDGENSTHALISVPKTDTPIPLEAEMACIEFVGELFPQWQNWAFSKTRVCWYCDTSTGDFVIDYHPHVAGLFVATGDSGHGFKVFPVVGEKIVDAIEGILEEDLRDLWRWRDEMEEFDGMQDGTRGGKRGMTLRAELARD